MKKREFLGTLGGALLLSGCGGGGGSSQPAAPTSVPLSLPVRTATAATTDSSAVAQSVARRFYMGQVTDVPTTTNQAYGAVADQECLLSNVYSFNGNNYDCSQPGMYVFMDTTSGGLPSFMRRLAWNGNAADLSGNAFGLLSGLSWGATAGIGDEPTIYGDYASVHTKWLTRKVAMRCGYQVKYALWVLQQYFPGLVSDMRQVGLFTGDTPNNYDDGHVCIEVKIGGVWKLFDINQGFYYTDGTGQHLNLSQIIAAGLSNCSTNALSASIPYCLGADGGFDYGTYGDFKERTADDRMRWRNRIFQIPAVMGSDGQYKAYLPDPYNDATHQAWLQSMNVAIMSQADWQQMFYG